MAGISKYYYNVGDDVRMTSNVQLNKIERGFYMKQVRKYCDLLESVDIEVDKDNQVTITAHLKTPQIKLTKRPQIV